MRKRSATLAVIGLHAAVIAGCARAIDVDEGQDGSGDVVTVVTHTNRPERVPFDARFVERLRVPEGLAVTVFGQGLANPRMMAVAPGGAVLVTEPSEGRVLSLRDADGDGHAEVLRIVAAGLPGVHGIHLSGRRLYLAEPTRILAADLLPDDTLGPVAVVYDDLPSGGQHPNRTLAIGPDGQLYVSVGSTCNACEEPDEEHAAILVADPGGSGRSIFARGLRNTLGFAWHPDTGQMWGMDNGSDDRGDDAPPEELNQLLAGEHYGWPWVYGDRQPDPIVADPPGTTKEAFAAETAPPALTYPAHSAPIGMVFYSGDALPPEYRGDAFVAMRGSWNRDPPIGYEVVRIRFDDGWPVGFEPFLTGFLLPGGKQHFGRPAGLAVGADGALLVSDDTNGVIYRVARAR